VPLAAPSSPRLQQMLAERPSLAGEYARLYPRAVGSRNQQLALAAVVWAVLTATGTALAGHVLWGESLLAGRLALDLVVFLVIGAPMFAWLLRRNAQRLDHRRTQR
jgi:uncharacterized RDD family membrane protein YckC